MSVSIALAPGSRCLLEQPRQWRIAVALARLRHCALADKRRDLVRQRQIQVDPWIVGLGVELWVAPGRQHGIHTRRGFPADICLTLSPPVKLLRRSRRFSGNLAQSYLAGGRFSTQSHSLSAPGHSPPRLWVGLGVGSGVTRKPYRPKTIHAAAPITATSRLRPAISRDKQSRRDDRMAPEQQPCGVYRATVQMLFMRVDGSEDV